MMRAIHQFVAGFHLGDAISNEALLLRRLFRGWGCESEIFCEATRVMREQRGDVRDVATAPAVCRPDDVVLLHLSTGSAVNTVFARLACRRALLYHNLTPPEYFRFFQPATAMVLRQGQDQLPLLARSAGVVLADSQFNADDLAAKGFPPAAVFPLCLDFDMLRSRPEARTLAACRDGLVNVLFVGRCAPNKKLEDVLAAFAVFQRTVEPASRLIFAGSHGGMEHYHVFLQTRVRELAVRNVVFTGAIPQARLNAWYRGANLFLCMSEHEGFCIPLIEAMVNDLPILAYAAGAVPETLDGAGVLVRGKNYPLIAELMGELIRNQPLRTAVIARQRRRLAAFRNRDYEAEIRAHLAPLLA
jgi:glycosyltransferase involved in cell wall biosynthesis